MTTENTLGVRVVDPPPEKGVAPLGVAETFSGNDLCEMEATLPAADYGGVPVTEGAGHGPNPFDDRRPQESGLFGSFPCSPERVQWMDRRRLRFRDLPPRAESHAKLSVVAVLCPTLSLFTPGLLTKALFASVTFPSAKFFNCDSSVRPRRNIYWLFSSEWPALHQETYGCFPVGQRFVINEIKLEYYPGLLNPESNCFPDIAIHIQINTTSEKPFENFKIPISAFYIRLTIIKFHKHNYDR